jgi:hypothetical protein
MSFAPVAVQQEREYRVVRYGPNESVPLSKTDMSIAVNPAAWPGDFALTHSSGVFGTLIRFGQRLRYWGKNKIFAHWSHAAIFVNDDGDIIEALGGGVQKRNISAYLKTEYVVVHLPQSTANLDRSQSVEFAQHCLHEEYGWLTIVSIAITLVSGTKLNFVVDGQQICSALVARCLERIGEIFTENEPWHLMPADLAKHFRVAQIGERGRVPSSRAGVVAFSKPGKRQLH